MAVMKQLENQIAVVTGAGRGIGRAIALKFAAHGADIVAVDLKTDFVQETVEEVRKLGHKAWAVAANVSEAASVEAAVEQILKEAGHVDILVNNAGITKDGLLMRMSEADWDAVLDINLKGTFLFTKAFSRAFVKQRSGRIVNIASVIGLIGNAGQCNYAASKAGVIGFTKSVARELASRGSLSNAIAPGFIETKMTAGARSGGPDRPAQADSAGQPGPARGRGGGGIVFRQPGGALYHRAGVGGGRRDGNVIEKNMIQGLTIPAFMA